MVRRDDWEFKAAIDDCVEKLNQGGQFIPLFYGFCDDGVIMIPFDMAEDEKDEFYERLTLVCWLYGVDHYMISSEVWMSKNPGEKKPSEAEDRTEAALLVSVNRQRVRCKLYSKTQDSGKTVWKEEEELTEFGGRLTELLPPAGMPMPAAPELEFLKRSLGEVIEVISLSDFVDSTK